MGKGKGGVNLAPEERFKLCHRYQV